MYGNFQRPVLFDYYWNLVFPFLPKWNKTCIVILAQCLDSSRIVLHRTSNNYTIGKKMMFFIICISLVQQEIFSQSLKQQNHFLIAMWYVGNKGQYWSDLPLLWKIGNFIIQRLYTSLTWRLCIWHDPRLYDSQWRYYIASKFQCIFLTNGIQQLQIQHYKDKAFLCKL